VERRPAEKPGCIRIDTSTKMTRSRKAMVTRDRDPQQNRGWPVNIHLAGVHLSLTVDSARDLAQQLQAVTFDGRNALDFTPPVRTRRDGTVLYNCGSLGMLTLSEAAAVAHCHVATIKQRVRQGITGEKLVEVKP
jgi:hypothetical protein